MQKDQVKHTRRNDLTVTIGDQVIVKEKVNVLIRCPHEAIPKGEIYWLRNGDENIPILS